MKIAISCHPTPGGSGVIATELAGALARRGHDVHLVAYSEPIRLDRSAGVTFHEVNVIDYPLFKYPPHDLSLANKLANLAREHDLDIIHAHYAVPHAVSALLAKQIAGGKVRIVTTLHGTDITLVGSHADFFELTRHAMVQSDSVSSVSSWLKEETQRRFDLPSAPEVIPNFVDASVFHARERIALAPDYHLVHASNLRPVKRISDVIRVFQLVQKQVDARLTIVGEGPEKGLAKELVAQLDLCDRVTFLPWRNDIGFILRSAHLGLLLSEYESFGLFALESLACGTPVAATGGGGMPEVVRHDETGLLCQVGDVRGLAGDVVNLLRNPDKWNAMSRRAAKMAPERFNIDTVVDQYEDLYRRAAANPQAWEGSASRIDASVNPAP